MMLNQHSTIYWSIYVPIYVPKDGGEHKGGASDFTLATIQEVQNSPKRWERPMTAILSQFYCALVVDCLNGRNQSGFFGSVRSLFHQSCFYLPACSIGWNRGRFVLSDSFRSNPSCISSLPRHVVVLLPPS